MIIVARPSPTVVIKLVTHTLPFISREKYQNIIFFTFRKSYPSIIHYKFFPSLKSSFLSAIARRLLPSRLLACISHIVSTDVVWMYG